MIFTAYRRHFFLVILLVALCGHTAAGQTDKAHDDSDLQAVIVIMRHGVRAPIESETRSSAYNAQAWPNWPTKPGVLTPHGAEALHLLGEFYRSRYHPLLQDEIGRAHV